MDEDLYPNDSSYWLPTEPVEQELERKNEQAKTLEAVNVLQDVVERLNTRIAYYASVDSIPDEVKLDPVAFMTMHNTNQLVRDNLRIEKENIEDLIIIHKRK
jgi:hypothetical protein